MNLVECRYNPNHKMKPNRREIHEQRCPDRIKFQSKFKRCPYDPTEKIKVEEYEKHLLECIHRPKITVEEQAELEKERSMNDIATEQEQIKLARQTYYKGCVIEPEVIGISKNNKNRNKKKQNKIMKKQFSPVRKKEEEHFKAVVEKVDDYEEEEEIHNIEDFPEDQNFTIGKNEEDNQNMANNKCNYFYKYNPNDEDDDVTKYSANVIKPNIYENTEEIEEND